MKQGQANLFSRCLRWLLYACAAVAVVPIALVTIHTTFSFCPLRLRGIHERDLRPVVYGLPTPRAFDEARQGKIVLGGCVPQPFAAHCPYCPFPARFMLGAPDALPLNDSRMQGLTPTERITVRAYASNLVARVPDGQDERVTALLVTPMDVYVGTRASGLHRYDRQRAAWSATWDDASPGCGFSIRRIRKRGTMIRVQHSTGYNDGLYYEDHTVDRGTTWKPE